MAATGEDTPFEFQLGSGVSVGLGINEVAVVAGAVFDPDAN
jgi:hypothetical protein